MQNSVRTAQSSNELMKPSLLTFNRFVVVLLVLTGAATAFFFVQAYHYLPVVSDNMYPESTGVVSAMQWSKGLPLYQDFRKPPYFVTSFPPLWYVGMGLASKAGISNIDSLTLFGRVLSLLALFGLCCGGYVWNRKYGIDTKTSLLGPLLYLTFPILIPWAVTARPDLPALLLTFLALYVAARELGSKGAFFAAVIASTAFLTRHSSVAAPVAIVLWFAYRKQWKQAAVFCAVWWSIVCAVMIVLQRATHGMFLLNLGGSKFGSMAITYIRDLFLRIMTSPESGFVIVLFAFGTFGAIESLKQRDKRQMLLVLYLLAALFFATLGSAAAGAAVNHFLDPVFALAVLAPVGIARLKENWSAQSPWPVFALVISMFILLPSLDMQRWNAMHDRPDNLRPLAQMLSGRTVFSDIPYISARSVAPQFLDPASLTYASRVPGQWSADGLVEELDQRRFDFVVLSESPEQSYDPNATYPRYPHLGREIRSAISRSYVLCEQWNKAFIYVRGTEVGDLVNNGCADVDQSVHGGTTSKASPPR